MFQYFVNTWRSPSVKVDAACCAGDFEPPVSSQGSVNDRSSSAPAACLTVMMTSSALPPISREENEQPKPYLRRMGMQALWMSSHLANFAPRPDPGLYSIRPFFLIMGSSFWHAEKSILNCAFLARASSSLPISRH